MSDNKQRLTLLNRQEIGAADTGGVLDTRIPESEIIKYLEGFSGTTFDTAPILDTISSCVGWYRKLLNYKDIEPRERAQQAKDTVNVISELMTRLENMHPDVTAHADESLWKLKCEFVQDLAQRINPDLMTLRAVLKEAAKKMDTPSNVGRKREAERDCAYKETYNALLSHSTPQLTVTKARAIAHSLLQKCGVAVPQDNRTQERIIRGG